MGNTISSYDRWNNALFRYFFCAENRGQFVYFHIDEEVIQNIAEEPPVSVPRERALESFLAAFNQRILASRGDPFREFRRRSIAWQTQSVPVQERGTPPFIGLLALCVLAASHMGQSERVYGSNYYFRMNNILQQIIVAGQKSKGIGMPQVNTNNFYVLKPMWDSLREWLNSDLGGALGLCTARHFGSFTHVGYPISQCLFRASDRGALHDFFVSYGFQPHTQMDPEDLIEPVRYWVQTTRCKLKRRNLFERNEELLVLLADIAAAEVKAWSGEQSQDESGRQSAQISLVVEEYRAGDEYEMALVPRKPVGFPISYNYACQGDRRTLVSSFDDRSYGPLDIDLGQALSNGVRLVSGDFTLLYYPLRVIPLAESNEYSGYISVTSVTLGEPYLVLCDTRLVGMLEQFLGKATNGDWRRSAGRRGIPSGWAMYRNVVINNRVSDPSDAFLSLVPPQGVSIRLRGGLKFDGQVWLKGAEPKIHVTLDEVTQPCVVLLDGEEIFSGQSPCALDLRAFALTPGEHTLQVGKKTRRLRIYSAEEAASLPGIRHPDVMIVHRVLRRENRYIAVYPSPYVWEPEEMRPGEVIIEGAALRGHSYDLPQNLPQPVEVGGGSKKYTFLGPQSGMVWEYRPDILIRYQRHSNGDVPVIYQLLPPFRPVWLIRGKNVSQCGEATPPDSQPWHGATDEGIQKWKDLCRKTYRKCSDRQLWEAYRHQASTS